MGAGDIVVLGPYGVGDSAAIIAGISGSIVVADDVTAHESKGQVFYTVVKAA